MRFGLFVAAAIALAPAAHADASCMLLQNIINGAPGGFADQKGEELDDGWFDSKLYLTGAEECAVDLSKGKLFYCVWTFKTPAAANAKAAELSASAVPCLAGWKLEDTTGKQSSNNLKIIKGIGLSGAGATTGTRVNLFAESYENSQESMATLEVRR
jgi:hypothetical protein